MDAFEQVVAEILWREGYWVRTSFKVELTKPEKKAIGLPSSPRWELDVVAYRAKDNSVKVVECKSYLDSPGVKLRGFNPDHADASRFKLFNKLKLREVVFERLCKQLVETGAARPGVTVQLCLACGHVASENERAAMKERLAEQGVGIDGRRLAAQEAAGNVRHWVREPSICGGSEAHCARRASSRSK